MKRFSISSPSLSFRASLRDPAMRLALVVCLLFMGLQGAFWYHTTTIKPEMGIVPDVPGARAVSALSFGDEEAFFRLLALNIQNSGDTFGRFTALYKYDYNKLYHWFHLLDGMNNTSNYLPSMAAYYFSQSQNVANLKYIVDYLDEHTAGRAQEKWWWIVQAVYLAQHKLNDSDRALLLANRLRGLKGIPIWTQQIPAFIHESRGEFGDALTIIEDVLKHPEQYTQAELNFMLYFVKERIHRFDELKEEFERAQKEKEAMRAKGIPEPVPIGPPPDVGSISAPAN